MKLQILDGSYITPVPEIWPPVTLVSGRTFSDCFIMVTLWLILMLSKRKSSTCRYASFGRCSSDQCARTITVRTYRRLEFIFSRAFARSSYWRAVSLSLWRWHIILLVTTVPRFNIPTPDLRILNQSLLGLRKIDKHIFADRHILIIDILSKYSSR